MDSFIEFPFNLWLINQPPLKYTPRNKALWIKGLFFHWFPLIWGWYDRGVGWPAMINLLVSFFQASELSSWSSRWVVLWPVLPHHPGHPWPLPRYRGGCSWWMVDVEGVLLLLLSYFFQSSGQIIPKVTPKMVGFRVWHHPKIAFQVHGGWSEIRS